MGDYTIINVLDRKLLLVLLGLAVPAAHLGIDDVAATLQTAQRAVTATTLALLLAHLAVLVFGEFIGQKFQQVLWP